MLHFCQLTEYVIMTKPTGNKKIKMKLKFE